MSDDYEDGYSAALDIAEIRHEAELTRLRGEVDALREFRAGVLRCRYPVSTRLRPSGFDWDVSRLDEVVDAARAALKETT